MSPVYIKIFANTAYNRCEKWPTKLMNNDVVLNTFIVEDKSVLLYLKKKALAEHLLLCTAA
jgi:hypothetical protein